MLKKLMKNNQLQTLINLSINDFKSKYVNSVLGVFWSIINPFCTIFIYWFVFEFALKHNSVEGVPYLIWMMAGILPWNFISESISLTTGAYIEYSYLVKKVVFNKKIIPTIKIFSAMMIHLFFIMILFIFILGYKLNITIYILQLLYYLICTIAILIPIGRINSIINIFYRDFSQFITIALQAGFWLTPIFWNIDILSEKLIFLFKLNPFFYIVEGYRNSVFYHVWFWENPGQTLYFWGLTIILLLIANKLYTKTEKHFSDVL